jgi:DNA (cytosine-5)-methyltransferase 1
MINVISTFSGCGGSCLGYKKAGFNILLATDWEINVIKTYQMNIPDVPVLQADIRNLTGNDILNKTGLAVGQLDILDGSPPCTPFSLAGLRDKSWNRSYEHVGDHKKQISTDLFFEFIRLVNEIKPKIFLAENVKGLIIGKAKGYFNRILKTMRELDYDVKAYLLNAKDFEVPQSRERIFFIGIRKDIAPNISRDIKKFLKTFPQITFRQAVAGLENTAEELKAASLQPDHVKSKLLYLLKEGQASCDIDPTGNGWNSIRLSYDKPSPTVTGQAHLLYHPIEHRKITTAEIKRLCSFPDDYKFLSTIEARTRLGNSVPPNMIYHIAEALKVYLTE